MKAHMPAKAITPTSDTIGVHHRVRRGGGSALCTALVLIISLAFSSGAAPAPNKGIGGKKAVDVYAANAYIGSDINQVLEADPGNLEELLEATTTIFAEVVYSDPPKRMKAIAGEIAARQPDVVNLVELYTLDLAPATMTGPGDFTRMYDYLGMITAELAQLGAHYEVAVVSPETDVTLPVMNLMADPPTLLYARLVDNEAILVRSDLPPGQFRWSNPQAGQFDNRVSFPELQFELVRGWCSIDVFVRGEQFRMVCSHLETEMIPLLQYAQALELLSGPAATSLPVIMAGDFNADPLGRNGTSTYELFPGAGFKDAWLELNPGTPEGGLTWGHDPWLSDPTVAFQWRLDLILYRGPEFTPTACELIDPMIAETPPLWPSDHAALAASISLGNPKAVKQTIAVPAGKGVKR